MKSVTWKNDYNVMLIQKILLYEPWKYKDGTVERCQIQKRSAESQCRLEESKFKVDDSCQR